MKQRKYASAVRNVLQCLVFPVLTAQILRGETGYVYLCVLTLVLMELPRWAEQRLHAVLPETLEILVLLFVFSSEILGEIQACYVRFPVWDLLLHGFSGFLFAAIGYGMLSGILRLDGERKVCCILFAVCLSMTAGIVWEFLEWGVDSVFGLDMQKDTVITALRSVCLDPGKGNQVGSINHIRETIVVLRDGRRVALDLEGYLDVGLQDTMGDLLVNLAGALVFAVVIRWKKLATHFIPVIQYREEP